MKSLFEILRKSFGTDDISVSKEVDLYAIPYENSYGSSLGSSRDREIYSVLLRNGKIVQLDYNYHDSDGCDLIRDKVKDSAEPLGIQLSRIEGVKYIIRHVMYQDDFSDDQDEDYIVLYPVRELDVEKVRRRLRDFLNKTTNKGLILTLAFKAGVKLD